MATSDLFALLAPPPALPPTLPGAPPLSPGSIILMLVAAAAAALEGTEDQPAPDPVDAAKKQQEEDKEDNKRVVKMKDVAVEIDNTLISSILAPLIYRAIIATLTTKGGGGFTQWTDLTKKVSDAEFDPIRRDLKNRIREHLLQQSNHRKNQTIAINYRVGELHQFSLGVKKPGPGRDPNIGAGA